MPQVLLPAVFLDNTVMTTSGAVTLMNQAPAASELNVANASNVELDISVPSGSSLTTASVKFDGVVVWSLAGGFVAGYTGSTSAPDALTLHVTIDPDVDFTSQQVVVVLVEGTAGAASPLAETYQFTVVDSTPPQVLSAAAQDLTRVRIVFNEAMEFSGTTGAASVLNPANYVFAATQAPSVNPVAASVVALGVDSVDVTVDIDFSPGIQYVVTVSNVADVIGNVIIANNTATFIAFSPPVPALRRWDLIRFLPQMNREEDITEELARFVACIQEVTDLILYDIDRLSDIIDPDLAKEPYLSGMLCDLGNPFSFEELTEQDKRRLISILVPLYKQKGTCVGIQNAIRFFVNVEVTCDEYLLNDCLILGESELGESWFLCPTEAAARYTFSIISPVALTATQRTQIEQIANLMKPAHTHLGSIVEPDTTVIDHVELGISELGATWELH